MPAFVLPAPIFDSRHIGAVLGNKPFVFDEFFPNLLLDIDRARAKRRRPIENVKNEVKAVDAVAHRHIKGCRGGPFFLLAAHMDVIVIAALISAPVEQPWITMKGKYDWLVLCEQIVKISVDQPVGMGIEIELSGEPFLALLQDVLALLLFCMRGLF